MRLYKNTLNQWFGTQAEARSSGHGWHEVNVPTDKAGLLEWLNSQSEMGILQSQTQPPAVHQSTLTKPHRWQTIKQCAEEATFAEMGHALAILMNRLEEAEDRSR